MTMGFSQSGASRVKPSRPARRYDTQSLNQAFAEFLGIEPADHRLIARYGEDLLRDGEAFARVFYAYLKSYPSTAEILKRYEARGGNIERLVQMQVDHLHGLLSSPADETSVKRLASIGRAHSEFGIEPVWVMGAYLLYWNHLQAIIRTGKAISEADRPRLEDAVMKLLFRDMGLMLEGYWDAAMTTLREERNKVGELQEQVTSLIANLPQVLWSVDVIANRPIYISPNAREVCHLDIEMPIPCLHWTVPEDRETVVRAWQQALAGKRVEVESRVRKPNDEQRWFRRVFNPFMDASGRVIRIDGLMEDATESKRTLERLHTLATTDSLTGLHNRTLLHDRLQQAIFAAGREPDRRVVLMMMDLNHFKEINDTVGHVVGDEILRMVGQRLRGVLRDGDTLARLGGDEFAVVLPHVTDGPESARTVGQKLLECFVAPFRYNDEEFYVGAALGVAMYPDNGEDVDTLMSRADIAMYGAKHKDVGLVFYEPTMDPHNPQRLQLLGDLRHALARNEFVLYYQPKVAMHSGEVVGLEALIRWKHPVHGLIAPDEFLPLAERSGLINPITDWVIHSALTQARSWHASGHLLEIAVNVSARTLQEPNLNGTLQAEIEQAGLAPELLELEVTENVLMSNIDQVAGMLANVGGLGVRIAIDDFGTGQSSLAYLKKLPLHTLKIDKSFVLAMSHDENDAVIVRSTIDLAHNLGYEVVAEGVEDKETWDLLAVLGCDIAQGHYVSPPIEAERIDDWLWHGPWRLRRVE